jgi:hypothetical protein
MTQTKADRQEAAKKAAATRERNRIRNESETRGTKAAASRQSNNAVASLEQAKRTAESAAGGFVTAAKHVGTAATEAGKSAATHAKALAGRR